MHSPTVALVQEAQIPLLCSMLLGGCAAKFARMLRVGSLDAGFGPTALFPVHLRRPLAMAMCVAELACGIALLVTAGGFGRNDAASAVRLITALLFLVATCALVELKTSHPEAGCGCFGDFSTSPVSRRAIARSALLSAAALATIGLPPLHLPHRGAEAGKLLGIVLAELIVIAALSPELSQNLVRLGYAEPCELRRLPASRTLAALHRSSQWRRRAGVITAHVPVDMWRELCWRYVVFPARADGREAEVVFAVNVRPHRPAIRAALVDAATGEVLSWPARQARRIRPGRATQAKPAAPGPAPAADSHPVLAPAPAADSHPVPAPAPAADSHPVPAPAPAADSHPVPAPAHPPPTPTPCPHPRPPPTPIPCPHPHPPPTPTKPDLVASGVLAALTDPGRGIPAIGDAPSEPPAPDLPFSSDL